MRHLVLEGAYQRFVVGGDTAEDVGDGAEVGIGTVVGVGGGEVCVGMHDGVVGQRSQPRGIVDDKGDRRGRGKVGVDEVRQAAAKGAEPGDAEDIVFG